MPIPDRLSLWPNDSALDARDQVVEDICANIDAAIAECNESDTSCLNQVISYMCCLSAVGNTLGGLICMYSEIETWRVKALQIYEWSWANQQRKEEYFTDRDYIGSVIDSLFEAVDHSTIPSERQEWKQC